MRYGLIMKRTRSVSRFPANTRLLVLSYVVFLVLPCSCSSLIPSLIKVPHIMLSILSSVGDILIHFDMTYAHVVVDGREGEIAWFQSSEWKRDICLF